MNYKAHKTKPFNNSFSASSHRLPAKFASSRVRNSWGPHQELRSFSSQAGSTVPHLSSASSPFLSGEQGGLKHAVSNLPRRRQPVASPRASTNTGGLFNYKFPPMTSKPRWWWRVLACLPYIMPFHETWMFAETAYHFHPLFEDFEYFTYPFLRALGRLPRGFLLIYFICGYLGIVRRKEWPHFMRFNMCLGMLLEIALQLCGVLSRWMPRGLYYGKIGMFAWTVIAFNHLFTVMGAISCALFGVYADVPFFSDAAYMQIPYSN